MLSWSERQALVLNIKAYYWDQTSTLLLRPSVNATAETERQCYYWDHASKLLLRPSVNTTTETERQRYCWDQESTLLLTLTTDLELSWVPDSLIVVSQFELVSELIWLVKVSLNYTRFLFLSETQGRSTLSVPFSAEGKKAGSRYTWWLQAKYKHFAIN